MIYAEIIFCSNDIRDIDVVLPYPPRIGENIEFPYGVVKYNNGGELEDRTFRIKDVDWVFEENSIIPKYKFKKLSVHVERL